MTTMTAPVPVEPTAADALPSGGPRVAAYDRRVPMSRLFRIELRKAVDTRASRWLLGIGGGSVVAILAGVLVWDRESLQQGFGQLVGLSTSLLTVFLMVVGVLAATSEWSQRTALTTFALEPRRGRIVLAKVVAVVALTAAICAFAVAVTALAVLVGSLLTGHAAVWSVSGSVLLGLGIVVLVNAFQGLAFGFATLNTPLAIGGLLVLPTVWTLVSMVTGIGEKLPWLDLNGATSPIVTGDLSTHTLSRFAGAVAVWVLLPLVVGIRRVLTSEVK